MVNMTRECRERNYAVRLLEDTNLAMIVAECCNDESVSQKKAKKCKDYQGELSSDNQKITEGPEAFYRDELLPKEPIQRYTWMTVLRMIVV